MDFLTLVKGKVRLLEMDENFLYRAVNEGFSGGEERNEILQWRSGNRSGFRMKPIPVSTPGFKVVAEGVSLFPQPLQ